MTARWSRRQWAILFVTCTGQFVTQLDLTVVNVAAGGIRLSFGASVATLTWVIDGYLVTFAAFMPGFGGVADVIGRRRMFLAGLALFTVCSVGCAAAPGAGWLIAARTVQGIAGAAVLVSSLALLVHGFSETQRTRAIGWWAAVAGTALVIGPVVGGLIVQALGWRWIFWINLPAGLAGLAGGVAILAESRGAAHRIDWTGQVLAVGALAALAAGLETLPADAGAGWPLLAAGAILAGAFIAAERRCPEPLVPPGLLRSRAFSGANATALLLNLGTLGVLFLLSLYLEQAAHAGAAAAGERIAPLFAAYVLFSPWAGRVRQRWGASWPAAAGAAMASAAVFAIAELLTSPGWITVALAGCGAGVGLAMPAVVSVAVASVPPERGGLASGLNNTARQIGNTLGVALLGGVVAGAGSVSAGVRVALLVVSACFLGAAVVAAATMSASGRPAPVTALGHDGG